jgi:hypothetical protein
MQYESDFPRSFMVRTRCNLENYHGQYEATQAINCLLGLLIVPKERLFNLIPDTALDRLDSAEWGPIQRWIKRIGRCD